MCHIVYCLNLSVHIVLDKLSEDYNILHVFLQISDIIYTYTPPCVPYQEYITEKLCASNITHSLYSIC